MADDVTITVINNTSQDTYGLVFQQDPNLNQIFESVFPTAWQVFQLTRKTAGAPSGGKGVAILPIQYEIGGGDINDAFAGHVSVSKCTDTKSKWSLEKNSAGFYELNPSGTPIDNTISVENKSGGYASTSLLKNSLPLLTYPKVPQAAAATFLPLTFIYVAWYTSIVQGSQIKASIGAPQAVGIDLTGAKTVEATLTEVSATGERKWEIKVNGQAVGMSTKAHRRILPYTVTERVALVG
jgi:hypothetical protein